MSIDAVRGLEDNRAFGGRGGAKVYSENAHPSGRLDVLPFRAGGALDHLMPGMCDRRRRSPV